MIFGEGRNPVMVCQTIAHYQLLEKLGEGGMGIVYKAEDTKLRRTVALKFVPPDATENRERFLREAQAAAALNHPNICTIHEIDDEHGFLAMEFIEGVSVREKIASRPLPLEEALDIAMQTCAGLQGAHAKGIVHRDIKSANLMLTAQAVVKIMDFGLAQVGDRTRITKTGSSLGTPAYMSPEQAKGEAVDRRTDIWSLAVVFYEMATGRLPFRGESESAITYAIIHSEPEPLTAVRSGVPVELDRIVAKALAKNPDDRYQHADELSVDLRRCRQPASRAAPARPAPDTLWVVIAAVAIAVASAAMGWVWRGATAPVENPLARAKFARFTDFEGSETDAAISRDGRSVAFRSDRDGQLDMWVSQVGTGHFVNLTRGAQNCCSGLARQMGFTPDGSELWLAGIIGGPRLRLIPLHGGAGRAFLTEHAVNVAWSPDGSQIVFHTYDTGDPMFVSDRTGAGARQIFKLGPGGHNHFPAWSVDGQWIYFISGMWDAREMDVWRIRPSGGAPERLTRHNRDVRYVAPLDGETLLYVSPDQDGAGPWLWALDIARKTSRRISSGLDSYSSVDATADGRRLAVTQFSTTAHLWSIPLLDRQTDQKDAKPFPLPTVRAFAPRYGGTSLFYLSSSGGGDGLWRYENDSAAEIWKGTDGALSEPAAVSFDGRRVALILRRHGKRTLHALSAEGGDLRPLAESIDVASAVGWSPDGKWIVAGGNDGKGPALFKIPIGGGAPVHVVKGVAFNPVWSPDGSVIVYTGPATGITGSLLMIRPDGSRVELPPILVRVGGERYRFVPRRRELVYLRGEQVQKQNFWMLDLATNKTRQLSSFDNTATRTFDITPDGRQIIFDRLRETSDIVLIDLPKNDR